MAKKPRPRRITEIWWTGIKRNPLKFWGALAGAIGGTAAVYGQWDNVVGTARHVWPASLAYADEIFQAVRKHEDEDKVFAGDLRDVKLDLANGKREATERAIDDYEIKKLAAPSDEAKVRIDQAIRREQSTLGKINRQIDSIQQGK